MEKENKKISAKEKLERTKKKVVQFYEKHEGVIWFIGGTTVGLLSIVGAVKLSKYMAEIQEQICSKDKYEPLRLFNKKGEELRIFKWDSGGKGDPMDMMFFPDYEVGWSNEIDWDKL